MVVAIDSAMEEMEGKNQELRNSLDNTKGAIDESHASIRQSQEVIATIKDVADSVAEENVQMNGVFESCDQSMDSIAGNWRFSAVLHQCFWWNQRYEGEDQPEGLHVRGYE